MNPGSAIRPQPPQSGGAALKSAVWKAWLWQQLRVWHWVSSALSLAGMLFFAFTGFTLNHGGAMTSKPKVSAGDGAAPQWVRQALAGGGEQSRAAAWIQNAYGFDFARAQKERQGDEILASLPRPGGDAWLTVDLVSGAVHWEKTDRGVIAFLNDLHKGRHAGAAWTLFLDVFAAASVVFCLTGLGLLALHASRRPMTWPAAFAGLVIPALLAAWLLHQ